MATQSSPELSPKRGEARKAEVLRLESEGATPSGEGCYCLVLASRSDFRAVVHAVAVIPGRQDVMLATRLTCRESSPLLPSQQARRARCGCRPHLRFYVPLSRATMLLTMNAHSTVQPGLALGGILFAIHQRDAVSRGLRFLAAVYAFRMLAPV